MFTAVVRSVNADSCDCIVVSHARISQSEELKQVCIRRHLYTSGPKRVLIARTVDDILSLLCKVVGLLLGRGAVLECFLAS